MLLIVVLFLELLYRIFVISERYFNLTNKKRVQLSVKSTSLVILLNQNRIYAF